MYCTNCGAKLADNIRFCAHCGKPTAKHANQANWDEREIVDTKGNDDSIENDGTTYVKDISYRQEFSTSTIAPWIKGEVGLDRRTIRLNLTNTILGFIPAGRDQQTIPLSNVTNVTVSSSYNTGSIILGVLLVLFGLGMLPHSIAVGIIALLVGTPLLLNGPRTCLLIQRGGSDCPVFVPFFEKGKMSSIKSSVDKALAYTEDKADNFIAAGINAEVSAKNTKAIIDAINSTKA